MSKYLYGASLQGLQEFIFETNKLQEIIGASEIIKEFDALQLKEKFNLSKQPEIILQAAGNLRAIFSDVEDVKKLVLLLPKTIMENAYGISISQSVVEYVDYKHASFLLEKNLKIQRNKNTIPLDYHFGALKINPKTGLPAVSNERGSFYDKGALQKKESYNKAKDKDKSLGNLELKNAKNKIAIVHIDGNGLGGIVKDLNENNIKQFSQDLDRATKEAYKMALEDEELQKKFPKDLQKIRKVILGGDDLTFICSANIALEFTQKFLEFFEIKTQNIYQNHSLSACAGIAFCNEKFPFFYAVKLAEDLCAFSKKDSKALDKMPPPSSLMFHNIQSSYVESFEKFIKEELVINSVCCDFGPYYLKDLPNKPNIKYFLALKNDFTKENSPKGRLRDWLNILKKDRDIAKMELNRIAKIFEPKWESKHFKNLYPGLSLDNLIISINDREKTPIYDILQILSVEDVSLARETK